MRTSATPSILNPSLPDTEARHRRRLRVGYAVAVGGLITITLYGFDYYLLDLVQRPFSPKHPILRPSGMVGLWMGILGAAVFLGIFLYPIRKRWEWLRQIGNTRHWLDFHVLMGLSAPLIIAFHSSFKFRGIAGMAFWIMTAVALSGVAGRYLYAQIPRSLSAAELSLKEVEDLLKQCSERLAAQKLIPTAALSTLLRLPTADEVMGESTLRALFSMLALDVRRALGIARLRRQACRGADLYLTMGGMLFSNHRQLERVIEVVQEQASLSKRIRFLNRSQQVFHLWHVVHKPFSYSFLVLACLHILVVLLFGLR